MTTTAPPRRRPEPTRLETPQVLLTALALLAFDAVAAVLVGWADGDSACRSYQCQVHGVSTTRPWIGVAIGAVVFAGPVALAWWRRRGLTTTLVVQSVAAAVLIFWAAQALVTAAAVRRDPPAVPLQPSPRPCAEVTLAGHTCLTYAVPTPTTP